MNDPTLSESSDADAGNSWRFGIRRLLVSGRDEEMMM
jgi:exonuclease V gamma subunit